MNFTTDARQGKKGFLSRNILLFGALAHLRQAGELTILE